MTFPIKLMEEGYRVRNYCWTIIQTIYFVKAYDSYNTLHQKYTNTEKMQSTWKTEHVLCFLKAGGSRISNMTFPRVKSKLHTYKYIFCINRGFNDIKYDTRTNNNNDPDPMTMDPTPTDPMTTNSYQTTMNPDRILNLPPFISALNYKLYSYSHHARAVVCGGSINCFHPLEAATSANGKNKAPP